MAFSNLMLTTGGMTLYAKAQQGKTLHFTRVALGDGLLGGGSMVNRSALISERMSMLIDAVQLVEDSITAAVISTLSNEGMSQGFYARELGLFAEDPDTHQEVLYLYAHAGTDGEYIPDGNSGTLVYERLKLLVKLENTGSVTFEASGNPLYLSAEDVEPIIQSYLGDLDAKTAGGTDTALTIALSNVSAYRAGMKVTVIAASDNGGAATTLKVNSLATLPVYKANTTQAPTMKAGKPYTLIVSSDLTHFFIEASAEGTAVAADVLAGETFSNDDDAGLLGTMSNRGAVMITPGTVNQAISEGYHNGNGYVAGDPDLISTNIKAGANIFGVAGNSNVVDTSAGDATAAQILSGKKAYVDGALVTGTIASKGAQTYTPGTANQVIAAGQYLSGAQTIAGDTDLAAENIKAGANIFGVAGSFGAVKSVQQGRLNIAASSGYTVAINAVDTTKSVVLLRSMYRGSSHFANYANVVGTLTDSTTLTLTANTSIDAIIEWQVIEFGEAKSIQTGLSTFSTAGTDVAVTAVNMGKALLVYSAMTSNTANGYTVTNFLCALTSATNIHMDQYTDGYTVKVRWYLIEFN